MTLGEDEVAYDGFIRVLQRRLRLPDGREATWDLLDVPATVSVLALTPDGRVVVVSQFRPGPNQVVVSLPGGLIDDGEDPADAALRELREETGYRAATVEVVAVVHPTNSTRPGYVAIARGCELDGPQDLDELEDIEVSVLDPAELRAQLRSGRLAAAAQTYLALDHAGLL